MDRKILFWGLIVLFLCLAYLRQCEDSQVKDFGKPVVFVENLKKSAVWRVKTHSLGSYANSDSGVQVIVLEDGTEFTIEYQAGRDGGKDWMLLNPGDTVIYQDGKIIKVKFK